MEYVYAALLLHKLQKEVNEVNISSVVKASGVAVNDAQVKALVAASDVNIEEAIKAAPVAVAAAAPAAAAAGEAKKEAPVDTSKNEEAAMEGLSSLFG